MFLVHPPQKEKPEPGYPVRPSGILYLRESDRYCGPGFILFICFVLCLVLFHDILAQSVILWLLTTGVFAGIVFFIRRKIRACRARRKSLRWLDREEDEE